MLQATLRWSDAVFRYLLAAALLLLASAEAEAQSATPAPASSSTATVTGGTAQAAGQAALTVKERLSAKWKDEQRVDNCNVPAEKRGTKPRPETCAKATAQ